MSAPGPTARYLARKKSETTRNLLLSVFMDPPPVPSVERIMSDPVSRPRVIANAGRWRREALNAMRSGDPDYAHHCFKQAKFALVVARGMQ